VLDKYDIVPYFYSMRHKKTNNEGVKAMSRETITHSCGHDEVHNLTGKYSDREHRAEWLADSLCSECYQAKIDAERSAAAETARKQANESGLPELTGSEKQITWAEQIRSEILAGVDDVKAKIETAPDDTQRKMATDALAQVLAQSESSYWIDNRDLVLINMLKEFAKSRKQ